jgi:hypothetical protein
VCLFCFLSCFLSCFPLLCCFVVCLLASIMAESSCCFCTWKRNLVGRLVVTLMYTHSRELTMSVGKVRSISCYRTCCCSWSWASERLSLFIWCMCVFFVLPF